MAGFSRYYTTTVWSGNDIPVSIHGLGGGTYPLRIWRDFMEKIPGAKDHEFYGDWVSQYMSEGYRSANETMIEMVDRLCADYNEEQLQNLEHIVNVCSQYEYMIWDMAWNKKMAEV